MGRINLLYFSIALIIRERLYFGINLLVGAFLIFYVSINSEIAHLAESAKSISAQIQAFSPANMTAAIGIFGLLSGSRIIHSIAETGIMLAVGTNRLGVVLLIVCKELVYHSFSFVVCIVFLGFISIFSNLSFQHLGLASLNALGFGIIGCIVVSIPLSFYVTSIDPYDSIRRQK